MHGVQQQTAESSSQVSFTLCAQNRPTSYNDEAVWYLIIHAVSRLYITSEEEIGRNSYIS